MRANWSNKQIENVFVEFDKKKKDTIMKYIESAMARNTSREKIREVLLRSNWRNDQINKVFADFDNRQKEAGTKSRVMRYIESAMARNTSREKIEESLIKSGWNSGQVSKVFVDFDNMQKNAKAKKMKGIIG